MLVIALAVVSLLMVWGSRGDSQFRNLQTVLAGVVIALGLAVSIGKSRSGRLVLTRRRWRYVLLIVPAAVIAVILVLDTVWFTRAPSAITAMFPSILGGLVSQMFEPEGTAGFKASDLGERDARVWRRILWACVLATVLVGSIGAFAAATGNLTVGALMLPFAGLFLFFAVAIWILLRSRTRQLKHR